MLDNSTELSIIIIIIPNNNWVMINIIITWYCVFIIWDAVNQLKSEQNFNKILVLVEKGNNICSSNMMQGDRIRMNAGNHYYRMSIRIIYLHFIIAGGYQSLDNIYCRMFSTNMNLWAGQTCAINVITICRGTWRKALSDFW